LKAPFIFYKGAIMTYGECKEKIRDLGFEENSTMNEYSSIVRNAVQRAVQFIFDDIVAKHQAYYQRELSMEGYTWQAVRPANITEETEDDDVIDLPDNVIELVPLLASHYVWMDDDVTKAVMYWNIFDSHKEEITKTCLKSVKASIIGGVRW
jgi:hypothetical protein